VVLNSLFKFTPLQSSFSVNNIALVDGRPKQLNLKQLIKYYVRHRHEVVVRRTRFELNKALKRAHILEGLLKALDIIDEIIALIRASRSVADARDGLVERFGFTVEQADAIVEMRLRQLTGLERDKLQAEYDELEKMIHYYQQVLESEEMQMGIIKDELQELKEKYGDPRRSEIALTAEDFNPEDFYPNEDVVITISHYGYIKRTSLSEYRSQSRGGVGAKGSTTRDEDFIEHIYVANMHSTLMFFTQSGKCFWLKVYEIPEGAKASKGRAIQNILPLTAEDRIQAYLNVQDLEDKEFTNSHYVVLATSNGTIKKTLLEAYSRPRANGIIAVNLREGDALIGAALTSGNCEILLAGNQGKCCRFEEEEARAIGRNSTGVRGIDLEEDDYVVGMVCIDPAEQALKPLDILVVSENGFGKRSDLEEYRKTHRGSKGVKTINITEKTGKLIALKAVSDENDLMIINRSGITIRMPADSIRVAGRATQGVKLISIREGDSIAAVCVVSKEEENENTAVPEENTETENNNQ
jgi:DNA gyrase subunit A